MESNRDEAERCINLAEKSIQQGNREKAAKFLHKAQRLFPSRKVTELLDLIKKLNSDEDGGGGSSNHSSQNGHTKREKSRGASQPRQTEEEESESSSSASYTSDQVEAVKRIRKCKDYYEILGLTKESNEADLKKAYRKLALNFHPDKNKAPGAGEAFKSIGNAYAVLSDTEKRRQYDLYGGDEEQVSRSSRHNHEHEDPSHGFQADMSAEEIFNMFFGGGYPGSTVYVRRGGRWQRQTGASNHHHQADHHHGNGSGNGNGGYNEQSGFSALFQILPILFLILMSMFSSLLVSDPVYSLQPSHKYSTQRKTSNMRISYYVKDNFHTEFTGSLRKLELNVEEDYMNNLRNSCFREKSYKENLLWQARYSGNNQLLNKAHSYPTPNCNQLEKIYAQAG